MGQPMMTAEEFKLKMEQEFSKITFSPAELNKDSLPTARETLVFVDDMTPETKERFAKCISLLVKRGMGIRTLVKYDKIVTPLDLSLAKMVKLKAYDIWVGKNPNKHQQAITAGGGTIITLSKEFPEINLGLWLQVSANPSYKMEWFESKASFIKKLTGLSGNLWLDSIVNPSKPAIVICNITSMEDVSADTVPWDKLSFQQKDIVNFSKTLGIQVVNVNSQYSVNQLESLLDEYETNNPTTIDLSLGEEPTPPAEKPPVPPIDTSVNEIPF